MTAWIVILAIGVGSYAMRATMLAIVATRSLPARYDTAIGLVGPAAIGALVAALSFTRAGTVQPAPLPELIAIGVGFVAVRRTGNVMHAFTAGLPALWLLTLIA